MRHAAKYMLGTFIVWTPRLAFSFVLAGVLCLGESCSNSRVHDFKSQKINLHPTQNVEIVATLKDITHETEYDLHSYFLHFDYLISNSTPEHLLFNFGQVTLDLAGCKSENTWYDSHIDYLADWDTLTAGEQREYHLYAAFPDTIRLQGVPSVEFVATGLR